MLQNKTSYLIFFFDQVKEELNRMGIDDDCRIIDGGGFNGNAFTPPSALNESSYFFVS